jgi:hypothetical protein
MCRTCLLELDGAPEAEGDGVGFAVWPGVADGEPFPLSM